MSGSIVQLHDSTVDSIGQGDGGSIEVRFSIAFVVKSEGIPVADPSTLWTQAATLFIEDAEIDGEPPDLPGALTGGSIETGGFKYMDMLPIPLDTYGYTRLSLSVQGSDRELAINGAGARLDLIGHARYVRHMEED